MKHDAHVILYILHTEIMFYLYSLDRVEPVDNPFIYDLH